MECYNCGQEGHTASRCTWEHDVATDTHSLIDDRDLPPVTTCYICGRPGHFAVACKFHPARLRNIRGDKCGPGPCTGACRTGDHNDCGFSWCTCPCHRMSLS